jgi:hypothetical protein
MNYCGHPGPGSTHQSAGGSPRRVLHRQNPCRIRGSRCPARGLAYGLPARSRRLAERLETGIPIRTLLWLGELHQYAEADGGPALLGRPADLLDDEGHMVITTVWPQQWTAYTAAARAGLGKADLAGKLLWPKGMQVPDGWTVDKGSGRLKRADGLSEVTDHYLR